MQKHYPLKYMARLTGIEPVALNSGDKCLLFFSCIFLFIYVYRFLVHIEILYLFCIFKDILFVARVSQMVIFYSNMSQPCRKGCRG